MVGIDGWEEDEDSDVGEELGRLEVNESGSTSIGLEETADEDEVVVAVVAASAACLTRFTHGGRSESDAATGRACARAAWDAFAQTFFTLGMEDAI